MSNSQTNTSVLLNHVKKLRELAGCGEAHDLISQLIEQEQDFALLLSDIQNGCDRRAPKPDEDAEIVLGELRERYAPTVQTMMERTTLLASLSAILTEVARIVETYERDIKGKEDAE